MPNGGITIRDAWNSAIVMEGGNIYIQPAKDLIVQPLRNFIAKVGGWTSIASKEDIDLSSSEKGFRLKTQQSQYFYSDKSGIVLQANSQNASTGSPDPAKDAISDIGGIVLKSTVGIYNYAETEIVYYAKKNMTFQSLENVFVEADKLLGMSSGNGQLISYAKEIINVGVNSALYLSTIGSVVCAGAQSTSLGKKDTYLGVQYDTKSFFIDILKGCVPFDKIINEIEKIAPSLKNPIQNTVFNTEEKFQQLDFKFLSSDVYGIDATSDAIPATMAQQDDQLTGLYKLQAWEEKEINSSFPYPGKDKFDAFYLASEAPKNLQVDPSGKGSSSKAKSENKPGKITLKSLNEYKIQK
jgi:hypothetical protein